MHSPQKATVATLSTGFAGGAFGALLREPTVWVGGIVVVCIGVSLFATRDRPSGSAGRGIYGRGIRGGSISNNKIIGYETGMDLDDTEDLRVDGNEIRRHAAEPGGDDESAPLTDR